MIYIFWIILLEAVFPQLPLEYTLISMSDLERFESNSDTGLVSNAIWDIRSSNDELLFFGTGAGLSFADLSSSFNIQYGHFTSLALPRGGNTALTIGNGIIAVSGVVDTITATGDHEPKGTGVAYSKDEGENWTYLPQPVDTIPNESTNGYQTISWGYQAVSALAVTTDIRNVSYDIAIGNKYIYTANWASGIRRYSHLPTTASETKNWEIIPLPMDNDLELLCGKIDVENYEFNPRDPGDGGNHNHKGFGVYVIENTLWAGTAAGINKGIISGDCINWVRHYQSGLDNISGNWVIGFTHQEMDGFIRLWAITWATNAEIEKYALSYTDDGGESWHITSPSGGYSKSERIVNLYANSNRIWATSLLGLYVSEDGEHWEKYNRPVDSESGEEILSESVYSAYYSQSHQTLWMGTSDGLALINDEASIVTRFWDSPSPFSVYPNPFLVNDYNQVENDGHVRFIYSNPNEQLGRIDVFDFSMDHVVHLNNQNLISMDGENEIIWNGRNDYGDKVANGVYFCRLFLNGEYYWTKLAVIN